MANNDDKNEHSKTPEEKNSQGNTEEYNSESENTGEKFDYASTGSYEDLDSGEEASNSSESDRGSAPDSAEEQIEDVGRYYESVDNENQEANQGIENSQDSVPSTSEERYDSDGYEPAAEKEAPVESQSAQEQEHATRQTPNEESNSRDDFEEEAYEENSHEQDSINTQENHIQPEPEEETLENEENSTADNAEDNQQIAEESEEKGSSAQIEEDDSETEFINEQGSADSAIEEEADTKSEEATEEQNENDVASEENDIENQNPEEKEAHEYHNMSSEEHDEYDENTDSGDEEPEVSEEVSKVASRTKRNAIVGIAVVCIIFGLVGYKIYTGMYDGAKKSSTEPKMPELSEEDISQPTRDDNIDKTKSPKLPETPEVNAPELGKNLPEEEKDQSDSSNKAGDKSKSKNEEGKSKNKEDKSKDIDQVDNTISEDDIKESTSELSENKDKNKDKNKDSSNLPVAPGNDKPSPESIGENSQSKKEQQKEKQKRLSSSIMVVGGGGGNATDSSGSGQGGSSSGNTSNKFKSASATQVTNLGNLDFLLPKGKIIDGVLESTVSLESQGIVKGLVSSDVYSESGKKVLIPRGSKLIGNYESNNGEKYGRLNIIWNRVMLPSGVVISLNSNTTDNLGRIGVQGRIDNKVIQKSMNAILTSAFNIALSYGVDKIITPVQSLSASTEVTNVASSIREVARDILASLDEDSTDEERKEAFNNICTQVKSSLSEITGKGEFVENAKSTIDDYCTKDSEDTDVRGLVNKVNNAADKMIKEVAKKSSETPTQKAARKGIENIDSTVKEAIPQEEFTRSIDLEQGTDIKIMVNDDIIFPKEVISKRKLLK